LITKDESLSLRTSRIGILSALYVVTGFIPISVFIGAPSFLALNLILIPTMAHLLQPIEAFSAALIGGLISLYLIPSQAIFGLFSILLPIAGATIGSLTIHKGKLGSLIGSAFLGISILAYLIVNFSFPYFTLPHILALGILVISLFRDMTNLKIKIPIHAFISTMCEQGMMMILAVHLLKLPWSVFIGILPLMIYERILATIGASILVMTIIRTTSFFS
jgi:hypothetical protein